MARRLSDFGVGVSGDSGFLYAFVGNRRIFVRLPFDRNRAAIRAANSGFDALGNRLADRAFSDCDEHDHQSVQSSAAQRRARAACHRYGLLAAA